MTYHGDEIDDQIVVIVNSIFFSFGLVVGYAHTAGLFIVGLVEERELKLRYLMNFAGL